MREKLADALNRQVAAEFYSGYLYLQMAAWFEARKLKGFANWMRVQAQEEASHAMIMFNHMAARGIPVVLGRIDPPGTNYESAVDVFAKTLAHEQTVTGMIKHLFALAVSEKDDDARSMLKWFVDEQVEEEESAEAILDKARKAGDPGSIAFKLLDDELAGRAFHVPSPLAGKL